MRSMLLALLVLAGCCKSVHTEKPTSPCAGKTVEFTYWHGSVGETYTLNCATGRPTIDVLTTPRYGIDPQSESKPISMQTWRTLWRAFESVDWRSLPADCGGDVGRPMLDLTIKDGKTAVNYRCNQDDQAEVPAEQRKRNAITDAVEAIAVAMYPSRGVDDD